MVGKGYQVGRFMVKITIAMKFSFNLRGGRCRDRIIVRFITTYAISAYHHWRCEFEPHLGELYSMQHYVMNFVSN